MGGREFKLRFCLFGGPEVMKFRFWLFGGIMRLLSLGFGFFGGLQGLKD